MVHPQGGQSGLSNRYTLLCATGGLATPVLHVCIQTSPMVDLSGGPVAMFAYSTTAAAAVAAAAAAGAAVANASSV
jgi:hypothetical protein